MKEIKEIINLQKKMNKSKGKEISDLLFELEMSLYILEHNFKELLEVISNYEKDRSFWKDKNRNKFNLFFKELNRLLHNYLASIFTLIEHTKRFKNKLKNGEFSKEYDIKLKSYNIEIFIKFIKDIRNLTQHKNLPPVSATLKMYRFDRNSNNISSEQFLVFKKDDLLEWGNWTKSSKDLIEEYNDDISLKNIFEEYQHFIKKFYNWINDTINQLYSKEFNEYNKIKIEISKKEEQLKQQK